jgi:hypothetical protein
MSALDTRPGCLSRGVSRMLDEHISQMARMSRRKQDSARTVRVSFKVGLLIIISWVSFVRSTSRNPATLSNFSLLLFGEKENSVMDSLLQGNFSMHRQKENCRVVRDVSRRKTQRVHFVLQSETFLQERNVKIVDLL